MSQLISSYKNMHELFILDNLVVIFGLLEDPMKVSMVISQPIQHNLAALYR